MNVGNGRILKNGQRAPLQVTEGDQVLFSSHTGTEIKINGQEYLIVREEEVFGVIE